MYDMIARFTNMRYQSVPLNSAFQLDMPAMLQAIEEYNPAVIFLAYPNNPTGNLFTEQDVARLLKNLADWSWWMKPITSLQDTVLCPC